MIQYKKTNEPELERKSLAQVVEVKEATEGPLHIKFYALAFGNVDSWGDIIAPGACDEWMKGDGADRMALCWQHDMQTVIGKITSKTVDSYGLLCEADVLPTTAGKDAEILLRAGAVKEFSIGYRADQYHYERKAGYDYEIRVLDKITIFEASPVTIAANPKAVLTDAKGANDNNQTKTVMTEQELKALQKALEDATKGHQTMAEELKTAQSELKKAQELATEQKKQIENLDKTAKDQQAKIDALSERLDTPAVAESLKAFIGSFLNAHKDEIEKKMALEGGRIRLETKTINDITTGLINPNYSLSVQQDMEISGARRKRNLFIELLGVAQRTADKLSWVEGETQDQVGYVGENAQNSNKGDSSMKEVQRGYGKLQTSIFISTEVADWYPILLDWAQNEATAALLAKFDTEIFAGANHEGAGTGDSGKIFGIKNNSTPFAAIAPVEKANVADVVFNACEQVANNGYAPEAAAVSPSVYFALRNLKDTTGNYILDRQTDVLCSDNRAVKVYKAYELTGDEIVVMDLSCVKPYAGNSFEFEAVRDADYDRWKFYFRLCGQNKIKKDWKKGLVYVASAATAITALTASAASE